MRHKNYSGGVMTVLPAALIAFAGVGCIVTAFDMTVDNWWIMLVIFAVFAAVCTAVLRFRFAFAILCAISAVACLFTAKWWLPSLEHLLYTVSIRYDAGYGWGWIGWSHTDLTAVSYEPALLIAGCLIILPITWTLCRRKWMLLGPIVGLIPLVVCCVVTSTVPSALFLTLLLAGVLVLIMTRLVRRQSGKAGSRLTALLLIPALLLSGLLLISAQKDAHASQAQALQDWFMNLIGYTEPSGGGSVSIGVNSPAPEVDLQNTGPRAQSDTVIMTVRSGFDDILYLRGQSYDTYTGTHWVAYADTANEGGWPTEGLEFHGDVTVTTLGKLSLKYFPYYIADDGWTAQLKDGVLAHPSRRQSYTFSRMIPSGENLSFTALSAEEEAMYLALPEDTQAAAQEILSTISSDADTVSAIAEYVRQSAVYDLNTQTMPEDETDFAIWFLNESDSGYCVHFASAATVLLRAAGIPARYVTGYATYVAADAKNIITADRAHAWVEYLDPNTGWTVLDATPGIEFVPETEDTETTVPTETETAETTTPSTAQTTAPTETTKTTQPQSTAPQAQASQGSLRDAAWLRTLFWVLLAGALLFLQYGLRLQWRAHRLRKGTAKRQALRRWKYVRRLARLTRKAPPEHLQALAEKAVFSQHRLTDKELSQFDLWIRDTHRALLNKPLPLRLLLKLILAIQ